MDQEQLSILLDKYLAGTCTPEEEALVQNWLNSRHTDQNEWHKMTPAAQQAYLDTLYKDVRQSIDVVPVKGRTRSLLVTLRVAAVAVVLLGAALLYILMQKQETVTVESLTGTKKVQLPDGSVVVLNAASKLQYAAKWKDREVTLEGEAFFDVKTDSELPFVINSGEVQTRVLGTSFNIQAYPKEEKISVGVITGKVEVSKATAKVVLQQGEVAVYNKQQGRLSHHTFNDSPAAWTNGELNFYHTPLTAVAAVLERNYNITIDIINTSSKQCEITGKFHVNQSIDEVLKLICKTIDATYEVEGSKVMVHAGNGCQH